MRISVPGRICLFGEHSDWAGTYRRINAEISPGAAIITGTNQGIHAEVAPHPSRLIVHATLDDGTRVPEWSVEMSAPALLAAAREGGFYSYAAGVAYQTLVNHNVRGLVIDNDRTDLPVKKGLSSSAAVCVLVARAFNRVYDLKLTVRGEMELAYQGEITTPSRCGRMDQGCAYGERPILMTFNGDRIDVDELTVGDNIHMVIVDLRATKNTREILNSLNHCYPFAKSDLAHNVQHYLGEINYQTVEEAARLLRLGDAAGLGALMRQTQKLFDTHVTPACPAQLTAPALHRLLDHPPLQPLIFGGKGVGSQGDGSAQLIARDAAAQEEIIRIVAHDLAMSGLALTLHSAARVRKAVIPAAGFGTRLFPATKAVKKELFPVVGADGRARPVILAIVEEALAAGIEEIAILVQARDHDTFRDLFAPPATEHYNKLSQADQKYCDALVALGHRVTILTQETQEGFGHAVHCARAWVGREPFLLLLGDHLYTSDTAACCARQAIETFTQTGLSTVGLMTTPAEKVRHYGCVTGTWRREHPGRVLDISAFAEKPSAEYAREHLPVTGLGGDTFLSLFGIYVLKPTIFDLLDNAIQQNAREQGEIQLTPSLDTLRRDDGFVGVRIHGQRHDVGLPSAYVESVAAFSRTPITRTNDTGDEKQEPTR